MTPSFDDAFASVFPALLAKSVQVILRDEDAEKFLAWMREEAPRDFPELFPSTVDADLKRIMATSMGRALWNAVPLPSHGYRPRPLPKPERNGPCPCGSGQKYKRCCAGAPPFPAIEPEVVWYVLGEQLPLEELENLGAARPMSADLLTVVAERLLKVGEPERALALLEPAFGRPEKLDERWAGALDILLEAYDGAQDGEGKTEMVSFLMTRLRPPLSATLWTHLCFVAVEQSDVQLAWDLLGRVRKDDPDDPNVALLEVMILGLEGRLDRVTDRARFHFARLRRRGLEEDGPLLAFLRQAAEDPLGALISCEPAMEGQVSRLRRLVEQAAARDVPEYGFVQEEGDEETMPFLQYIPEGPLARLEPPEETRRLEESWKEVWPLEEPEEELPDEDEEKTPGIWTEPAAGLWLGFLESHPAALDSLRILSDLTDALEELVMPRSVLARHLLLPLADRGLAVLESAASRGPAGAKWLWYYEENQPALLLVDYKIDVLEQLGQPLEARRLQERFLELDPGDYFNNRSSLVNSLLEEGEDEKVLLLTQRHPIGFEADLTYGRILALHRLGRLDEAKRVVEEAYRRLPLPADYLLGRREDVPEDLSPVALQVGGADQGWWYEVVMGETWKASEGALDWLREVTEDLAGDEEEDS